MCILHSGDKSLGDNMEVLHCSRCTAGLLTPLPKASDIAVYRQDLIQHTFVLLSLGTVELYVEGLRWRRKDHSSVLCRSPPANGPLFATSLIRISEVAEQAHKDDALISAQVAHWCSCSSGAASAVQGCYRSAIE